MFSPQRIPLGLYIEHRQQLLPVNLNDGVGNFFIKPNGVLYFQNHSAGIVDSAAFSPAPTPEFAIQPGPVLLQSGTISAAFNSSSSNRAIRSGVGIRDPHTLFFALSTTPVTFYEFATLFKQRLGCTDALYLDGTISKFFVDGTDPLTDSDTFAAMFVVTTGQPAQATSP